MIPIAAQPKYERGATVFYVDNHDRPQTGRVTHIEATWASYAKPGSPPYCVYTVTHPTYRNGRTTVVDADIRHGFNKRSPGKGYRVTSMATTNEALEGDVE